MKEETPDSYRLQAKRFRFLEFELRRVDVISGTCIGCV